MDTGDDTSAGMKPEELGGALSAALSGPLGGEVKPSHSPAALPLQDRYGIRKIRLATASACASIMSSCIGSRPVRCLHSCACVKINEVPPISV